MSVCVSLCLRVSVCVHNNSKTNQSINLKLEHIVVYENSMGNCTIKSDLEFSSPLTTMSYISALSCPISQLCHKLRSCG